MGKREKEIAGLLDWAWDKSITVTGRQQAINIIHRQELIELSEDRDRLSKALKILEKEIDSAREKKGG